jgi:hypothetical protein
MTVYVNKLRGQGLLLSGRTAPPPPLYSLTADSEDELHALAERLGIRRNPGTPPGSPEQVITRHYTLTEGERDRAVQLGAQPISARQAGKLERQRAAMRGESLL